jgi:hypothetical protein
MPRAARRSAPSLLPRRSLTIRTIRIAIAGFRGDQGYLSLATIERLTLLLDTPQALKTDHLSTTLSGFAASSNR